METGENGYKKVHVGRNIRIIREYLGIKQEVISIDLGLSQSQIHKIEHDEEVDDTLLEMIADSLGISAEKIKTFDVERALFYIKHYYNLPPNWDEADENRVFNAEAKIIELYERLLASGRETIEILSKLK